MNELNWMLNKKWAFETLILHLNLLPANYKLRRWKHAILFVKATKMLCSPGDHKQWWSTQCRIGSPSISKWRMDSRIPITTAKAASELSMQIAQIYEGNDCSRVQWWCVVGFGNFNLLNARSRCSIIIYSHLPPVPTPANTVFTCHLALLSHHSSWTFSPLISRNPPRG